MYNIFIARIFPPVARFEEIKIMLILLIWRDFDLMLWNICAAAWKGLGEDGEWR